VRRLDPDHLLDALDPDQRSVALQVSGPLAVMAGAGTGKTRAITYRMAYGASVGAFDPTTVLALTFTSKAAVEMRSRLRALGVQGVQVRTFHSAALRQLQYFSRVKGFGLPTLISRKSDLMQSAMKRLNIAYDTAGLRDVIGEIEWAQAELIRPERYVERTRSIHRQPPMRLSAERFADVYDAYESIKGVNGRNAIDFGDVITFMYGLMVNDEDVARTVRSQYRSFVVDEYQDVSTAQHHLLNAWLGDRHDICVVGDVAQTIYSFAGAKPSFLTNFARDHPGARVVTLTRDYRSTPQIVAVANQVLAHAKDRKGTVHLVSQREMGPGVRFKDFEDDDAEAAGITQAVGELRSRGVSLSSIAVLYRTNVQSQPFEQAFTEAGIPVILRGGDRFFERQEIRRSLVMMRREAMRESDEDLVSRVKGILTMYGWSAQAPEVGSSTREVWDNLDALVALAESHSGLSLAQFVAELEERAQAQAAPPVSGVTLSTLHAAKGLEWDAVFIVGAAEGLLPFSMSATPEAREEERRLLYVGVTRARDYLQISWARRVPGKRRKRKRSTLLDGIWPEAQAEPRSTASSSRARSRERKDTFEEQADPLTTSLFETLRSWRLETSQESGTAAYNVFGDQTLMDIAFAKPKTLSQLRVIKGIGEVKADLYGPDVLRIVRQTVESSTDCQTGPDAGPTGSAS
jgi:DNA helicase-2/ATP-dependent DNA helicase PcrA